MQDKSHRRLSAFVRLTVLLILQDACFQSLAVQSVSAEIKHDRLPGQELNMAMASRGIGFGLSSFVQGACRTCKVSF